MTWLLIAAYVAGYVWCFRFVVGYLLDDYGMDGADLELVDVASLGFLGAMFTLVWPVLVLGRLVQRWFYSRDSRSLAFFRAPARIESPRARVARLERERDARERRIAELEAELGIGADEPPAARRRWSWSR
jgi:hypothetical protein